LNASGPIGDASIEAEHGRGLFPAGPEEFLRGSGGEKEGGEADGLNGGIICEILAGFKTDDGEMLGEGVHENTTGGATPDNNDIGIVRMRMFFARGHIE